VSGYYKITLTGMDIGVYPVPPNIIYVEGNDDWTPIGAMDSGFPAPDNLTYFVCRDWGTIIRDIRYVSYYTAPNYHYYAKLSTNDNADFQAAVVSGNWTGSYTGAYGEIWNIEDVYHEQDITTPAGEGGDVGITFTNTTPSIQAGGEPPPPAQNPTPVDTATGIRLSLPQILWEAG